MVVIGSTSVVRALQAADAIDEYRLLTIPSVIGDARAVQLFTSPAEFELVSVEAAGPAVLTVLAARSA